MEPRNEKNLEYALTDIITAKPHEIRIGRKVLRFYPVTLAKTFVLRRWMDALKIDVNLLQKSPYVECLRLVGTQRDIITEILAVHSSPNTRKDLHDSRSRSVRRNLLASVKQEHLAALLLTMLTQDKTEELTVSDSSLTFAAIANAVQANLSRTEKKISISSGIRK